MVDMVCEVRLGKTTYCSMQSSARVACLVDFQNTHHFEFEDPGDQGGKSVLVRGDCGDKVG